MADESDVFEDCGSDFEEDEGDWAFTDGASASVLQLIGGASPARSAAAEQQPPAGQGESKSTQQTADDKHSDDDLLNELFPEKNIETTDELKQRQSDGGDRRASECEVEWALMALEEHDQLGRSRSEATTPRDGNDPASLFEEMYGGDTVIALSTPPHPSKAAIARSGIKQQSRIVEEKRDTSPKHIEVAAPSRRDEEYFVSLFEEMYGGDAAISLSTPPPPTQATAARSDTKQQQRRAEEKIDTPLKHVDAASSPARNRSGADDVEGVTVKPDEPPPDSPKTFIEDTPEMIIPVEILHMLRLVHNAATTGGVAILPLVSHATKILCLPAHLCPDPGYSVDSLAKVVCVLEESLRQEEFVQSFASTREERLELVLVALDDTLRVLCPNYRIKWAKTIDMLPVLTKMRLQTKSQGETPTQMETRSPTLHIDTAILPTSPAEVKSKMKQSSTLAGWATFRPDKMPARRQDITLMDTVSSKQSGRSSNKENKARVIVRQYQPSTRRMRCKIYNPEERELTFRPRINTKYLRQWKGEHTQRKEDFTVRMQEDISYRRLQKQQQEKKREEIERQQAESALVDSLIAKGSQRILLKNGMWSESLEERLSRLAMHRTSTGGGKLRSRKSRHKQQQRKLQAALIASRACDSLYQRAIEQRNREAERVQEEILDIEYQTNRPKMSDRSLRVMKARIRQELSQLCADSRHHTMKTDVVDVGEIRCVRSDSSHSDLSYVTFVQFSCALLYFGFVPDLNTPWQGENSDDNCTKHTLLWHSWTVFTEDGTGVVAPKLTIKVLERVLFAVILGDRFGGHQQLQGHEVQVLLQLFRTNYYARKHTPLKSERIKDVGARKATTQTSKRNSTRRGRVHYSLHGKPIRNGNASKTDPLSERERLLQTRIGQMREEKSRQELQGCTFHPNIIGSPRTSVPRNYRPVPDLQSSDPIASTFERLYSDAFQRQNNVLEKYLEAKLHREEIEKRESKVRPSYVNGLTIEERLNKLQVALASNALPVDFHRKIALMRTATEVKLLDEQEKAQRLQPVRFKRAQDGRTIVLPFEFATEIRAGLSAELKKIRQQAKKRPRDRILKGVRPSSLVDHQEVWVPVDNRDGPDNIDTPDADICLDVHLSPSETHPLYLNFHEEPIEAVAKFAQRFALNNEQRDILVQLVEARLERIDQLHD